MPAPISYIGLVRRLAAASACAGFVLFIRVIQSNMDTDRCSWIHIQFIIIIIVIIIISSICLVMPCMQTMHAYDSSASVGKLVMAK